MARHLACDRPVKLYGSIIHQTASWKQRISITPEDGMCIYDGFLMALYANYLEGHGFMLFIGYQQTTIVQYCITTPAGP